MVFRRHSEAVIDNTSAAEESHSSEEILRPSDALGAQDDADIK